MEEVKGPVSAREVLERHLELSRSHDESDFLECYRDDSFLIMPTGVRRGREAIRACYRQLNEELPHAYYTYKVVIVEGEIGFLEWSAESPTHIVEDGADTYVIRDGYIKAQTIHYTVVARPRESTGGKCEARDRSGNAAESARHGSDKCD